MRGCIVLVIIALAAPLKAHEGGHGKAKKELHLWKITGSPDIRASFLFLRENKVHLESEKGDVIIIDYNALSEADKNYTNKRNRAIEAINGQVNKTPFSSGEKQLFTEEKAGEPSAGNAAADTFNIFTAFSPFADIVTTRSDNNYFYVESRGWPKHNMMVGIRSWQQQVPLPQPYAGTNAWQIPLHPVLAATPISAKYALFTGGIALAINGVAIFNALNNRGDDAYLYGELDQWGGHCGRADDYHYHIAPLHFEQLIGKNKPIGVALDGFPLYGSLEPDSTAMQPLDSLNGHFDNRGKYHYHGTLTYPYINGGMRGVVTVQNDQITPQPRTTPVRPFLQPLSGALVTGFTITGDRSYSLQYTRNGGTYYVNYRYDLTTPSNTYTFDFVDPQGNTVTKIYRNGQQINDADEEIFPDKFSLKNNYPNPFNPSTTISYELAARCNVTLKICNSLGEIITTAVQKEQDAGFYSIQWNGSAYPSGVYYCILQAGTFTAVRTLLLMK